MYEVLIVEDDPMVAMINKQYVNQNPHFHVCQVCRDGSAALTYLRDNTVHLTILDLYMPKIDGLTLLHKIREEDIRTSVIMVTAANDGESIEKALDLGIVDYLVKPFANDRFEQALETFLKRQDAFHDLESFSQQHIDALMASRSTLVTEELPKGIQEQTLRNICDFLSGQGGEELTGEEIADVVGLSRVTVRRYMNFLLERGTIVGRMNYETGGRPSMLYRWNG
ncbi:two-component system, CitB family, response regulator MalR [Lachnospiraceae bacterium XBB1006]|nr:two-component system, CitB family, response regulator MalR [Lachnospiraceae bacterium XBB1006]